MGSIFGTDEYQVYLHELTQPFTSRRAPTLVGKPKLFFIQSCRVSGYDTPSYPRSVQVVEESDGHVEGDANASFGDAIPWDADFLLGMATVPNSRAYRNTATGSIYIQELCRQLTRSAESSDNDDIHNVLTRVNREVTRVEYLNDKQIPEPKYTLTKKLVLKSVWEDGGSGKTGEGKRAEDPSDWPPPHQIRDQLLSHLHVGKIYAEKAHWRTRVSDRKNGNFLGVPEVIALFIITREAVNISKDTTIRMIDSLKEFFLKYKKEEFQKALDIAGKIATDMDATPEFRERRGRKRKRSHGDDMDATPEFRERQGRKRKRFNGDDMDATPEFRERRGRKRKRSHGDDMDATPEFRERQGRKRKRSHGDDKSTGHFEQDPRCMDFNVIGDAGIQELSNRFSDLQLSK